MSVENGWCRGGVDRGEQMRDDLINATIEWFLTSSTTTTHLGTSAPSAFSTSHTSPLPHTSPSVVHPLPSRCCVEEKLHWDDVSEYLYDALLNEFHVDAQDQSEEQLARLLCRLHDDCLARGDFSGLHKLQQTRKAAHRAKEEARRQTKVDMRDEDDEEEEEEEEEGGEDGEAFDERDEEEEAKREEGALDGAMESLAVRDSASSTEGKEEAEAAQAAAQPPAEDDGWTTVGSSKPQRSKRRGK